MHVPRFWAAALVLRALSTPVVATRDQPGREGGFELAVSDDATCHVQFPVLLPAESQGALLLEEEDDEEAEGPSFEALLWKAGETDVVDRVLLNATQGEDGLSLLAATIMIRDLNMRWSPDKTEQPDWVLEILARNVDILQRHGHGMIVREGMEPLDLLPWQKEDCKSKEGDVAQLIIDYLHQNTNRQKEAILAKYLAEPGLTHVAVLDADVVFTQSDRDTLRELAQELDREGKDLFLADEDWRSKGAGQVNGGFILAKVTDFSKDFFRNLTLAHEDGGHGCINGTQLCLEGWLDQPEMKRRTLVKTGSAYNCHPRGIKVDGNTSNATGQRSLQDSDLHVLHFMGAAKAVAPRYLSALGGGPDGSNPAPKPGAQMCSDGQRAAACFTVDECLAEPAAEESPSGDKFAFVLSHSLEASSSLHLPVLESMRHAARRHDIDILLLVPQDAQHPLSAMRRLELGRQGVQVIEVPWSLPPQMQATPAWCSRRDFIRLHSFNLTGYAAVAYYDSDMEIQGDVVPALRCASRGYFLTTSGPLSPLNLGFMAFPPSSGLFQAALEFAQKAVFTNENGWAGGGSLPSNSGYVGYSCGQGFLYTLLYKKTDLGLGALRGAGVRLAAKQLDRCEWNYQWRCPARGFQCSSIRVHHKGAKSDCWQYEDDRHLFEQ